MCIYCKENELIIQITFLNHSIDLNFTHPKLTDNAMIVANWPQDSPSITF